MKKRRRLKIVLLLLILALAGVEIAGRVFLSGICNDRARQFLNKRWPGGYQMGEVSVSLVQGGIVTFRDLSFNSPEKPEKVLIEIPNLRVGIGMVRYLMDELVLDEIRTSEMKVDLERLEDETFALDDAQELLRGLCGAFDGPSLPSLTSRAYADSGAERIQIRKVRLLDTQFRFADHHTHEIPPVGELSPLNIELDNVVYPQKEGETPGTWRIEGTVPSPATGRLGLSGEMILYATDPSFTVNGSVTDLDAAYAGKFIPDDLDITVHGGLVSIALAATCDRGRFAGTWSPEIHNLDADVNVPLFGWDIKVSRDMVKAAGRDFRLNDIPFDCEIYDAEFEFQECLMSGLDAKMDSLYRVFEDMSRKGLDLEDVSDRLGPVIEKLGNVFEKKEK